MGKSKDNTYSLSNSVLESKRDFTPDSIFVDDDISYMNNIQDDTLTVSTTSTGSGSTTGKVSPWETSARSKETHLNHENKFSPQYTKKIVDMLPPTKSLVEVSVASDANQVQTANNEDGVSIVDDDSLKRIIQKSEDILSDQDSKSSDEMEADDFLDNEIKKLPYAEAKLRSELNMLSKSPGHEWRPAFVDICGGCPMNWMDEKEKEKYGVQDEENYSSTGDILEPLNLEECEHQTHQVSKLPLTETKQDTCKNNWKMNEEFDLTTGIMRLVSGICCNDGSLFFSNDEKYQSSETAKRLSFVSV